MTAVDRPATPIVDPFAIGRTERPRRGRTTIETPLALASIVAGAFKWGDAVVGAAAATGALLILIGSSLILLRHKLASFRPTLEDRKEQP